MRSIETQAQKEERRKRNVRAVSFFLLAIMVLSTIGYAFILFSENRPDLNNPVSQNGDQVQTDSGQWIWNYGGQMLILQSSKEAVKNISVDLFLNINNYQSVPVYIDAQNSSAVYQELAYNLNPFTYKLPAEACYGPCSLNLPEKNCSDYLIVYQRANENKVYQQDNCVFIEGDIRGVDAFLYQLFESA